LGSLAKLFDFSRGAAPVGGHLGPAPAHHGGVFRKRLAGSVGDLPRGLRYSGLRGFSLLIRVVKGVSLLWGGGCRHLEDSVAVVV